MEVEFPKTLQKLDLDNYSFSLDGVIFPENLKELIISKYKHSLVEVKFPEKLQKLDLYFYSMSLDGVQFSHELTIIVDYLINDPKFELIKDNNIEYYYTYLKYPRDHFIKHIKNI